MIALKISSLSECSQRCILSELGILINILGIFSIVSLCFVAEYRRYKVHIKVQLLFPSVVNIKITQGTKM